MWQYVMKTGTGSSIAMSGKPSSSTPSVKDYHLTVTCIVAYVLSVICFVCRRHVKMMTAKQWLVVQESKSACTHSEKLNSCDTVG